MPKGEEDVIIVASEDVTGSGNEFPTLPASTQTKNIREKEKEAPYFMATSEVIVKPDQPSATGIIQDDSVSKHGKHKIPRPNIQQYLARSTRKEDENHLIYRRDDEKGEEGGDDLEVNHTAYFLGLSVLCIIDYGYKN